MRSSHLLSLALPFTALSQSISSLTDALSSHPETSLFKSFLSTNPTSLTSLFNSSSKYTLLVPTNDAITDYETSAGVLFTSLTASQLSTVLQYHVLVAPLTASNFSAKGGITVPTLLTSQQFNNRSAGEQLVTQFGKNSNGQVLYFSEDDIASTQNKKRVVVRQAQPGNANVRAGGGEVTTVDVVDGTWDGGNFQIVNNILSPPLPCSSTIRPTQQLSALDAALNRTRLWDTLDHAPNVTCLAPNTAAFAAAGNPQDTLTQAQLQDALLFHTLPQPLYTNFLTDGQEITSLGNLTVRVTINGTGTYFNDARVLAQNVLTNNGVIHILEKVMSPLANATGTGAGPSSTSSGAPSATTTKGEGSGLAANKYFVVLVGLLSVAVLV